ncbi:MAG: VWA domain-containing protein [Acetatifactor sp.]|nr:VWA domain-containing protein [Acetatifactor sp.]
MIFESLWPLALLSAIPVVIILYLLKPRGKDYRISSNLLWDKLFRNMQSKTFLEKFIHNLLMYLQILILVVLILALMSPYLNREGRSRGNVILVFDTSGSMQHDAGEGRTRLEEALTEARDIIASSEETAFSVVTGDCTGASLLAVGVRDKTSLSETLDSIVCCDGEGSLQAAESIVETLRGAEETGEDGKGAEVIVFTDGIGASYAMSFSDYFDARVYVMGEAVDNVSNNFLSYVDADAGTDEKKAEASAIPEDEPGERTVVCASGITNYGDVQASMEVSLYEGERLVEIRQLTLEAGETRLCFFDEFSWRGEPLRSEIGSVRFAGKKEGDSLAADNVAYAIPEQTSSLDAVLIGNGNTYIEKAYQAATGQSLPRAETTAGLQEEQVIRIYDAGTEPEAGDLADGLMFGGGNAVSTVTKVLLTVSSCDLTAGLSAFSIGVNETAVYEIPDWGTGFLWAGEQCAGYYGEQNGKKTVVVGFDLRESDFPLKAEFPVFLSNVLHYLGDTSLLANHVYAVGDRVVFHPQADFDVNTLQAETGQAGLYQVSAGEKTEHYVVRFAAESQSDGRITASGTSGTDVPGSGLVKRQFRNVLLVLALVLMAAEWILYVRQSRSKSWFYRTVRAMCALLVLLAVLGLSVNRHGGAQTTVFLVDISNSNEQNLTAMEDCLNRAVEKMPQGNQYAIVTFGKNSVIDQFLTGENRFTRIMSLPDKTATNFEEAMSRALAMIPSGSPGRIVLLTDGRQTKGELANTASALVSRQTELLAVLYDVTQGQDAYVENVELPSYLYQGDAYNMTVTVESNYETDAQIQIWMGSILTAGYDVHLSRGTNQFRFRQEVRGESVESFEVRVAAPGDTCRENDSYHAYSVVDSLPKILLVSGLNEDSSRFEELLRSAGCNYSAVSAINAPSTLDKMLEFKSIILENVYLSDLPEGFLASVETYVKDYGCGLVCCGGRESFALGGYKESVLETVLPVDMQLRGVNEAPAMAMVMVIDHSGSMGVDAGGGATNLDLAITAAKTAVDQLRSTDYVGVLSFDNRYSWAVEPTELSDDQESIKTQIETISEGGGTTIQPALWAALEGISDCDADIRHVILLTDGQGESDDYRSIVAAYTGAGVTLSTVAVGEGSDAGLLEKLAEDCRGRFYYSDMASEIPKIFAQEVFLSGDTYLQNGEFTLAVNGGHEITRGLFEDGWPLLYGYVSATPKNTASVLLASDKDDPVLTVMQYGLGHTVAWNTDVTNQWTAGYAGKSDYVQLWKRMIDYSAGNAAIGEDSVEVVTAGGATDIVYQALDYGEQTGVEAVYTDPEGNTRTEKLHATAPGRYEARLDTDLTGIYNLSVRRIDDGAISNAVTTAAAVQYSDEYKFDVGTGAFTQFVDRYGRLADPEENFWQKRKSTAKERYQLTKWLILLAIVWFVADIALRRFHFLPQDTRLYRAVRNRLQSRAAAGAGGGMPQHSAIHGNSPGETDWNRQPREEETPARESPDEKANSAEGQKKPQKQKKQKKQQENVTLDTSALLKKKDQRNQ